MMKCSTSSTSPLLHVRGKGKQRDDSSGRMAKKMAADKEGSRGWEAEKRQRREKSKENTSAREKNMVK
jgi:hypothetical protein